MTEWRNTGFVISGFEGGRVERVIALPEMTRNGSFVDMHLTLPTGKKMWLAMRADDLEPLLKSAHGESFPVHVETDKALYP